MWNDRWRTFLCAVFLTSLPALLVELTLTRIFSVVFYYHFAFLAISLAMFGLGAGGMLGYALRNRAPARLGWAACANSLAVIGALAYLVHFAGRPGVAQRPSCTR
jgi:hypothetical protein